MNQHWLKLWRIKANETKSMHVTFTLRRETFLSVNINNRQFPYFEYAKYFGMDLDHHLTWKNIYAPKAIN